MELTNEETLTSQVHGDVTVMAFDRGRIRDEREVLKALQWLCRHVEEEGKIKLVLDMENVEYLSSAGLGSLACLLKRIRASEGALRLCNLQEQIIELFEIMRLDRILDIFPSVPAALKDF